MAECKHGLRAGCYYCHARQARPDLNRGTRAGRTPAMVGSAVVAKGALTHDAWRGEAKVTAGRMGLRAYIGWYGASRPVAWQSRDSGGGRTRSQE